MNPIYILTSEYNEYDQHGEYFVKVYFSRPTIEQIATDLECDNDYAEHILKNGGRLKYEYVWYFLREFKEQMK